MPRQQRLLIKNMLLGAEAKADECNVIEAQAPSANGEVVKIPIAVLKVGENRSMNPLLEFPDGPVTFKLTSGTGPVHLHGLLGIGGGEMEEEVEYGDEINNSEGVSVDGWRRLSWLAVCNAETFARPQDEDQEEEEADADEGVPKKKSKLAANNGKPNAKNAKK